MLARVWFRTGVNDATKDAKKDTVRHTSRLTAHLKYFPWMASDSRRAC